MNKYDVKKREEVGYKDMEKYKFGGLEVEELLTNGYLMYVPYGIHVDIFQAVYSGILAMEKQIEGLRKIIKETENSDFDDRVKEKVLPNFYHQIKELEKHKDVLSKIYPILDEV
jgi:hypothetical protein